MYVMSISFNIVCAALINTIPSVCLPDGWPQPMNKMKCFNTAAG